MSTSKLTSNVCISLSYVAPGQVWGFLFRFTPLAKSQGPRWARGTDERRRAADNRWGPSRLPVSSPSAHRVRAGSGNGGLGPCPTAEVPRTYAVTTIQQDFTEPICVPREEVTCKPVCKFPLQALLKSLETYDRCTHVRFLPQRDLLGRSSWKQDMHQAQSPGPQPLLPPSSLLPGPSQREWALLPSRLGYSFQGLQVKGVVRKRKMAPVRWPPGRVLSPSASWTKGAGDPGRPGAQSPLAG